MSRNQPETLFDEINPVIEHGICVGCGACAVAGGGSIAMERTVDGACVAKVIDRQKAREIQGGICPFSSRAPNEDDHGAELFGDNPLHDEALGRFKAIWAGYCDEGKLRERGSSGGIASWVAEESLRKGVVDAVVHVHPGQDGDLFEYGISRTIQEVRAGAKTRYYSVNFSQALQTLSTSGERFALIGVPCFIKAARNLLLAESSLKNKMMLTIALVCGHMKSAAFAESLSWQIGVPPEHVATVDFRVKLDGVPANQYGFSARDRRTDTVTRAPMAKMVGRRWDGGYHRLKACDYCDDVFGETADITCGDAWLPEFSKDSRGTNVVVVRSARAAYLLAGGMERGALKLVPLDKARAVASQAGGLRDRREGLAYRLYLDERARKWFPVKRVGPNNHGLTAVRKINYKLRRIVRERSAASFKMCKRLGFLWPYKIEMTFWHACFRLLQIVEGKLKSMRQK